VPQKGKKMGVEMGRGRERKSPLRTVWVKTERAGGFHGSFSGRVRGKGISWGERLNILLEVKAPTRETGKKMEIFKGKNVLRLGKVRFNLGGV